MYAYTTVGDVINSNLTFDIAFIDIELGENETGFKVVQFLKNQNRKCVIAFFTNYNKYAIKGYRYQPFRYILKTEPDKLINRQVAEVFNEYYRKNKIISGSYNGYTFSTALDDIYYISISNHVSTLYTKKGNFEIYKQMRDFANGLSGFGFLRCHRSYIVNLQHVTILRSDFFFILDNSNRTAIPIGIRYRSSSEKIYINSCEV